MASTVAWAYSACEPDVTLLIWPQNLVWGFLSRFVNRMRKKIYIYINDEARTSGVLALGNICMPVFVALAGNLWRWSSCRCCFSCFKGAPKLFFKQASELAQSLDYAATNVYARCVASVSATGTWKSVWKVTTPFPVLCLKPQLCCVGTWYALLDCGWPTKGLLKNEHCRNVEVITYWSSVSAVMVTVKVLE